MIWFTADWHFGDDRFLGDNPLYRPFTSLEQQHRVIIDHINAVVQPEDQLFHLGDVCVTLDTLPLLDQLNCQNRTLILGNYDDDQEDKIAQLPKYFKTIQTEMELTLSTREQVYLNHYPVNAKPDCFNIVGHIHGLWKVQPNMVNVGVDAWHFRPVSETRILYLMNAVRNHYDQNVFPNKKNKKDDE